MDLNKFFTEIQDLINTKLDSKERISLLRGVLDMLFKELTKKYQIVITTLQARIDYYCQQENISKASEEAINELRIFCNKVVHSEITDPTENNQKFCVKILAEFISNICKIPVPEEIKVFYTNESLFYPLLKKKTRKIEEISEIQGIVKEFSKDIKEDRFGKRYFDISIENDESDVIHVRLTESDRDNYLIRAYYCIWVYAEIIITDVIYNLENGNYYSTLKTLLIIEPKYTIDVKQIASGYAFSDRQWILDPSEYQKKKFEVVYSNSSIVTGYLLGEILDEVARRNQFSFIQKADEYFKKNPILSFKLTYDPRGQNNNLDVLERIKIETQSQEINIRNALERFSNFQPSIEPTFLSIKYGIQGRLDLLYENKNNLNERIVIELKSGNYRYDNPQHRIQTSLYDLLLRSTYPNRVGNSYILYSQKPHETLTLVNSSDSEINYSQKEAMYIRNKMVSDDFKILNGNLDIVFKKINDYLLLTELERLYFEHFIIFIGNELKAAKEKHLNTLLSNNERNASSKFLSNLEIIEITDDFLITLNINPDNEILFDLPDFKENDYIIIFPVENDGKIQPLNHPILKGIIIEIDEIRLKLSLINKQLNKEYLHQYKRWTICQDLRESTIKKLYQQLYLFITSLGTIELSTGNSEESPLEVYLSLDVKPTFTEVPYSETKRLTPFQNEIVKRAISCNHYFIIQGPPGTGKTRFILTEIVRNIYKNEKVVVIAYTNQAISEICKELSELGISFLQLGGKGDQNYQLIHHANNFTLEKIFVEIKNAQIIISTQHTLTTNLELLDSIFYRTLIVDEASQILEPQLVGILTKFKRSIFIGDEKQLPAISLQEESEMKVHPTLAEISLYKLNESLFYRLLVNAKKKKWDCFETLKEQGRMHVDIADFSNIQYYSNQLESIFDIQQSTESLFDLNSENPIERCLALSRVLFIPSQIDKISFKNDNESLIVSSFISTIIRVCKSKNIEIVSKSKNNNELSIGVITPFRKQITNIKRAIPPKLSSLILIDTIEKFQGSERDIIIYSTSINQSQQLEKLQSLVKIDEMEIDRKLNVALTRAKKHLIITGVKSILEKSSHYKKLIQHIEKKGGFIQLSM